MSVERRWNTPARHYPARRYASGRRHPGPLAHAVPWVLAGATVVAQIAYPLAPASVLGRLTIGTVVLFFLASASHALIHRGPAWTAGYLLISLAVGLGVEVLGVHAGWPFGRYSYSTTLGPELAGVPLVIPAAWAMMAYPALLVARRLTRRWVPLVGGLALAAWDLALDPQMVAAGHWTWAHPHPGLPGVAHIPATNFAGWLVVAVVLMALLDRL
ncbi:MAG: carotenoid biosynthesis protein, partial [Actinomycetes bacterium]